MKYINAEKLKAEIERHIKDVKDAEKRFTPNMGFFDAKLSGIYDVLAIIDSLLQEQSISSNFNEAVAKYLESQTPADQGEEMMIYNAFKEGANWVIKQLKEK